MVDKYCSMSMQWCIAVNWGPWFMMVCGGRVDYIMVDVVCYVYTEHCSLVLLCYHDTSC